MKQKLKDCWTLFYVCLIMGATCFGGGYGMIPVMEREFVTKRNYVSESDMADIVSLAQSLPGLISFNTVILISYRKAKFWGVLSAVLGLLIPSLVIISVIVVVYELIADNKWVNAALKGIKCAVIGVLIYAVWKLAKTSLVKWYHYVIAAFVLLLSLFVDINPIYIILIVGVTFTSACYINDLIVKKNKKQEKKEEQVEEAKEETIEEINPYAIDLNAKVEEQEPEEDKEEFESNSVEFNINAIAKESKKISQEEGKVESYFAIDLNAKVEEEEQNIQEEDNNYMFNFENDEQGEEKE